MAKYAAFEEAYKRALHQEIRSTRKMSAARRKQLVAGMRSDAKIDLSLIRNVGERRSLQNMLMNETLRITELFKLEGTPGVYLPSTNPFRQTSKMVVGMTPGQYQPFADILQQAYISIDPLAEGLEAEKSLSMGMRNLPSVRDLTARAQRGGHVGLSHLDVGKKLFFLDTETTGVTDIDLVRSISVGVGEVRQTAGVKTVYVDNQTTDLGARFRTSQMAGYISADPYDLNRVTTSADAVIEKETNFGRGNMPRLQGQIHDLTSEAGRTKAKDYFENLFTQLSSDDAHMVAYNGQFDVGKMVHTARSVGVDESVLSRFETRMNNGGLVDVLGLTRERLNNRLAERLANVGSTAEQKAIAGLSMLLSPESLTQARVAGEAVKAFSLENVVQSTNFLEILARDASQGDSQADNLLNLLSTSQASHVDITDRMVAERTLQYMDQIDFRYDLDVSGYGIDAYAARIDQARINVASSRAIVPTTNLADPRYLTQSAYRKVTQEGMQKVELNVGIDYLVNQGFLSQQDIQAQFGSDAKSLTLKYDPNSGAFRFYGPSPGGGFDTNVLDYTRTDVTADQFIRQQIDRVRGMSLSAPITAGEPTIQSLGISLMQSTNIERVGQAVNLSNTAGALSKDDIFNNLVKTSPRTLAEDELFDALVATRQHVGFNYIDDFEGFDSPLAGAISRVMRGFHDVVKPDSMDSYMRNLSKIDLLSASVDPKIRSAVVGISTITSEAAAKNIGFISKAIEPGLTSTDAIAREAELTGRAEAFSSILTKNARYLSEFGAITFETQKGIVAGSKITLASRDILKNASTIDNAGNKVGFLSDEALKSKANKARLSIAERTSGEVNINMVYGGGYTGEDRLAAQLKRSQAARASVGKTKDERIAAVADATPMDLKRAKVEAESLYEAMHARVQEALNDPRALASSANNSEVLRAAGLAETESQADNIMKRFGQAKDTKEGRKAYREFKRNYMERGIGIGSVDETGGALKMKTFLRSIVGETTDSDALLEQLGLKLGIADINDTHVTAFLRSSDEAVDELARITGRSAQEILDEASPVARAGKLQGVLAAAEQDIGFFDRLRKRFTSLRVNFGVGGTDFMADRMARDESLMAMMAKVKPKIYTGVGAVAALSAGYYIAKRKKQNDLYDEVMESQPTEKTGPMSIRDFNDIDQQMASVSSSRRDPLMTAGVVGNLDRNKVSHYKMGPKKYDHLYGR